MLDRIDGYTIPAERGGVIEAAQVVDVSGDLDADIGPPEADTVLGRRGLEVQPDGTARMRPMPMQPTPRFRVLL